MSQIIKPSLALVLLSCLMMLSLAACGDNNSRSHYEPDQGEHPDGWLPSDHAYAALEQLDTCRPCHGTVLSDPSGGISKVSCMNCHFGNETDVHPLEWGAHDYARHDEWVRQNGNESCANAFCHGTQFEGVPASGPSCSKFDAAAGAQPGCHLGDETSVHPLDWFPASFTTREGILPTILPEHGDYVNANGGADCSLAVCHGSETQTVIQVGMGSTRITGTTPTTGLTGATEFTGTGAGEVVVRQAGRSCRACHF